MFWRAVAWLIGIVFAFMLVALTVLIFVTPLLWELYQMRRQRIHRELYGDERITDSLHPRQASASRDSANLPTLRD